MKFFIPALILLGTASAGCSDSTDVDKGGTDSPNDSGGSSAGGSAAEPDANGGDNGGQPAANGGKPSTSNGGASSAEGGAGQGGEEGSEGGMGGTDQGGSSQGGSDSGDGGEMSGGGETGEGGSGGMDENAPDAEVVVMMMPTGVNDDWADFAATATFTEEEGAVTLSIVATAGCPDGEHAWHIHQNGSCGDQGQEAGNHWGVGGNLVGEQDDALTCSGGMGTTEVTVPTDSWTLMAGEYSLRNHAIMVHEGGVDNPGDRMACGVIPE